MMVSDEYDAISDALVRFIRQRHALSVTKMRSTPVLRYATRPASPTR